MGHLETRLSRATGQRAAAAETPPWRAHPTQKTGSSRKRSRLWPLGSQAVELRDSSGWEENAGKAVGQDRWDGDIRPKELMERLKHRTVEESDLKLMAPVLKNGRAGRRSKLRAGLVGALHEVQRLYIGEMDQRMRRHQRN